MVSRALLQLFGIADGGKEGLGRELAIQVIVSKVVDDVQTAEVLDLPRKYKIKGIVDSQESFVFFPLKNLREFAPIDRYEQMQVKVRRSEDLEIIKDWLFTAGFEVSSVSEIVDQANKIFRAIQFVLGLFGAFSLVVSSIGMFNTMTVTLLERTNEIGIMRALGASRRDIMRTFLSEALVIGFLGGLVGTVLGFLGGEFVNLGLNVLASRFGGNPIDLFVYPTRFILIIIGISAAIGFFAGVFPSRRAARMDPLAALRYK